jgi:hypothetical protein
MTSASGQLRNVMAAFALRSDRRKFIIDLTSSVLLPFYILVQNSKEFVSPSAVSTTSRLQQT